MKNFILDTHPCFGEMKVKVDGTDYQLVQIKGNGCVLIVSKNGTEQDRLSLSKTDLRALFGLICTEK